MTKTQSTVTARLDRKTANSALPALTNALHASGSVVNVVLDTVTARNLLLALTHSLQASGTKKKKKKGK
ncbi:MAG TPA: hypothetical protein VI636_14940 [Candidatus Angelobacter sp.]